jgi:hypothetical protein
MWEATNRQIASQIMTLCQSLKCGNRVDKSTKPTFWACVGFKIPLKCGFSRIYYFYIARNPHVEELAKDVRKNVHHARCGYGKPIKGDSQRR